MRLVKLKFLADRVSEATGFYQKTVLPILRKTKGCLYATLTESSSDPNELISLTLWDSLENMEAYQEGGPFQQILRESKDLLARSTEWRVQLSEENTLEYGPAPEEPKVRSYEVHEEMGSKPFAQADAAGSYVRLLRLAVRGGRLEKARKTYDETILPVLRDVEGCRYACLLGSLDAKTQLVSLTVWDSREDAERYDRGEVFRNLLEKTRDVFHTQSWTMSLSNDRPTAPVKTQAYEVVAGSSFVAWPRP